MKKKVAIPFAALSLMSCLTFSATSVAYADNQPAQSQTAASQVTLTEQQAVDLVTKLFAIPKNFTQQNVNLESNWMGQNRSVYMIWWQGPTVPQKPSDGLNVVIDAATGQVLQYNRYNRGNNWSTGTAISAQKAQSVAQDWLHKLAPAQSGDLVLQPNPAPQGMGIYAFWYVRKVGGVLAPFDSVQLSLTSDGQLNNFSLQWTDATFPDASSVLQAKDVQSTYNSALGLHLQYQTVYGWPYNEPKTVLTYTPADYNNFYFGQTWPTRGPWIDANSGQLIGSDGQPQAVPDSTLTPIDANGGKQLPAKLSQPLTEDQAEQALRTTLGLSSDYTVVGKSHSTAMPMKGFQTRSIQFTFRNDSQDNVSAAIDTDTGLIMSYNHYNGPSQPGSTPPAISDTQAQQAATSFIKKVLPNLTGAIALAPSTQVRPPNWSGPVGVNFVLLVNGIPAGNVNVMIDPYSGTVQNYYMPPNISGPFPAPDHAISLASAQAAYLEKQPMVLQYVLPVASTQPDPKTGQVKFQSEAKLVYAPLAFPPGYLDAISGQWVQYPSQGSEGATPTDIHGHYGEKEMLLLAQRGFLTLTDGKAHPDAKMTRAQFVSLLVRANSMYYGGASPFGEFKDVPDTNPYYAEIMQAVQQGWLPLSTNFYPDKPITRADAADLLVSFLGWHSLASHSGLFSLPFKDAKSIPAGERGDAAIAAGYGLIPSVKGNFLPNQAMTVADSAVAVVRALQTQSNNRN